MPSSPEENVASGAGKAEPDSSSTPSLGRYSVEGEVGRGGMGAVFRVRDALLDRSLAMKVILGEVAAAEGTPTPAADPKTLGRFLEEAKLTAQLEHPGIVPVHELGRDAAGRHYFTMRLVQGRTLADLLHEMLEGPRGWSRTRAVGALLKVCESMAFAHSRNVVHRDLKPENIMVGEFGEVYVMDWGLACLVGEQSKRDLRLKVRQDPVGPDHAIELTYTLTTAEGDVVGTPSYMSPEQARGEVERVGCLTDVYGAGAILYQILAGHRPYAEPGSRRTALQVWELVRAQPPTSLRSLTRGVPEELLAICEKAMARDPGQRYGRMMEMAEDLRSYLENRVVKAYRTGAWAEFQKWISRNRALASTAGAALFLIVAGTSTAAAVLAGKNRDISEARDATHEAAEETKAVNDFLVKDLLLAVTPQNALGRKVTVEEVLLTAREKTNVALATRPKIQAAIRHTLGDSLWKCGNSADAIVELRKSYEWRAANLGPDSLETLQTQHTLAWVLMDREQLDEAQRLFSEVLDRRTRILDADELPTLTTLRGLAMLYRRRGDLDRAEKYGSLVYEGRKRRLGPTDVLTLMARQDVAIVEAQRGRIDRAIEISQEVRDTARANLPPDHPVLLTAMAELGYALRTAGRLVEAEALYRELIPVDVRVHGASSLPAAIASSSLARVLLLRYREAAAPGLLEEAEILVADSLAIRERLFGDSSTTAAAGLADLGEVLVLRGEFAKARARYQRALEIRIGVLGPDHEDVAMTRYQFGNALHAERQSEEAAREFQLALVGFEKALGPAHFQTAAARASLGKELASLQRHAEAEVLLLRAFDDMQAGGVTVRHHLPAIATALAKLYDDMADPEKASAWRIKGHEASAAATPAGSK